MTLVGMVTRQIHRKAYNPIGLFKTKCRPKTAKVTTKLVWLMLEFYESIAKGDILSLPINSHVQIPKSIMKNFSHLQIEKNEKNQPVKMEYVYFLDLSDQTIKKESIKKLDTVFGYYSQDTEEFLRDYVEGPVGDLMKNARLFHQGKTSPLTFDVNAMKNYICYALLRSQLVLNEVNRPSATKELLEALGHNSTITHEKILMHPEALAGAFDNFSANTFENNTDVEFVVPRNCTYYTHYRDGNLMWVAPFSPKGAFVLVENGKSLVEKGVFHTDDSKLIEQMNVHALQCELTVNRRFIVASRERELEMLTHFAS
ncbi:MAG: hypothetical protein FWC93_01875 [Defluviitaleaceae bacterium]|nr:hypothetical protein [Defluviitaleaceae bacterium]